ncbi:MAG: hypothetical protein J6Q14_05760 [Oscillospiraceae bacterium]|nr:hypothetical protein [Oscillospiraceae bacterium]
MKRKILKALFIAVSVPLILVLCWFGNAFFGNPLSYFLATRTAQTHLVTTYPGTDFYIERVGYDFKISGYYAHIKSPSSADTYFSVYISMLGKVEGDTYSSVVKGFNTARRLNEEYRALTDRVFHDPAFPYNCFISFGELEIHSDEAFQDPYVRNVPFYAFNQKDLILDKSYNIPEMGRQAGRLYIYVDSDVVTVERAAQIMLDIKEYFDQAGVPFRSMDFTLQYPFPDEGLRPDGSVTVLRFLYEDIYADELAVRVDRAHKKATAYYEKMDAIGT